MFFSVCIHSEESPGGLLFTSSKEKVDKRTALALFGDKLQYFENTFGISFDLSIWDSSQFGHIFRAINNRKQEVEFVFVNFYGTDQMYLDFHSPITHKSIQIPIKQEDIDKKTTLHLDIDFDLQADRVSIALHDTVYTCEPIGLDNPSQLQFAFGLYGLNLDVPHMLIKNLRIRAEKEKTFFFPLSESQGEFAYDETGKITVPVKNPEWIVNKHFYWQAKAQFTVSDKTTVTYDEARNCILVIDNDSVWYFYPRYNKLQRRKPDSNFIFTNNQNESNSLHHNIFYSVAGDLYRFGGYANHSYSNRISIYNEETKLWETIDFKGDKIKPRFYSAIGDGIGQDEKLLFGGFGNETGKQEHGGRNFYDLHLLNLKQQTVSHLWTLKAIPEMEFIPGNNLILSRDKKSFYALCYAHHMPKTVGYLYRFNLQNGDYDVMSDSICFTSEDMNTSVNLFYNKELCEFYAIIRDLSEKNENHIRIYSLLSPPITKAQLKRASHSQKSYGLIVLLAIVFILILAGSVFFVFGRRKAQQRIKPIFRVENESDQQTQKHSAVYLFGNFTVFDRQGRNISYRFSAKLKVLFALVLLNTNRDKGISTENLTLILWPDKDGNNAKNIRGVTINRLRHILEDLDGIMLVNQNHQWFFTFKQPFYCDWHEYSGILQRLNIAEKQVHYNALMDQLVAVIHNGRFLLSVQDNTIDNYKSKEEEKLEQLLNDYIIHLFDEKQYRKIIWIVPIYFSIDPLNEKILNISIKSYNKLGKKEEAKSLFKNYKRTYKRQTGKEYRGYSQL